MQIYALFEIPPTNGHFFSIFSRPRSAHEASTITRQKQIPGQNPNTPPPLRENGGRKTGSTPGKTLACSHMTNNPAGTLKNRTRIPRNSSFGNPVHAVRRRRRPGFGRPPGLPHACHHPEIPAATIKRRIFAFDGKITNFVIPKPTLAWSKYSGSTTKSNCSNRMSSSSSRRAMRSTPATTATTPSTWRPKMPTI